MRQPDLHRLLTAMLAELKGLRADLAAEYRPAPGLPRLERERMGALAAAVSASIGDEPFTVRDLLARADESDAALRAELAAIVGELDDGAGRRLGRLLARCAQGDAVPGYRVERIGEASAGCAWRVSWV